MNAYNKFILVLLATVQGIVYGQNNSIVDEQRLFLPISTPQQGTVILMQGNSSCGKTSTARALQKLYSDHGIPFVLLEIDSFIRALPRKWRHLEAYRDHEPYGIVEEPFYHPDGLILHKIPKTPLELTQELQENNRYYKVPLKYKFVPILGKLIYQLFHGIAQSIKGFAQHGINVIFEGALPLHTLKADLASLEPYLFFIDCPLHVAEEREVKRKGHRGLARGLATSLTYKDADLTINCTSITPEQAAQKIFEHIQQQSSRK